MERAPNRDVFQPGITSGVNPMQTTRSHVVELSQARRRYVVLRNSLDPANEMDRDLHAELTATIRALDQKIAALSSPLAVVKDRRA